MFTCEDPRFFCCCLGESDDLRGQKVVPKKCFCFRFFCCFLFLSSLKNKPILVCWSTHYTISNHNSLRNKMRVCERRIANSYSTVAFLYQCSGCNDLRALLTDFLLTEVCFTPALTCTHLHNILPQTQHIGEKCVYNPLKGYENVVY